MSFLTSKGLWFTILRIWWVKLCGSTGLSNELIRLMTPRPLGLSGFLMATLNRWVSRMPPLMLGRRLSGKRHDSKSTLRPSRAPKWCRPTLATYGPLFP